MKNLTKILIAYLILAPLSTALAKSDKFYQVEVIVFEAKNKGPVDQTTPVTAKPTFENALTLLSDPKAAFGELPPEKLSLLDAKKKLERKYTVLMHKGWRQQIAEKSLAKKVHLVSNSNQVDGVVKVSAGNYMHADVDMTFQKEGEEHHVRLKDSSRLKVNELHYVDHPTYGVIMMVSPE